MSDTMSVFAGECTTTFEGSRERTQRGSVVVVVKPDKTVLVHDADGYQPVAWLTRPDTVTVETAGEGFGITARAGDQTLRVVSHESAGRADYPVSEAGVPVGRCPDCRGALVRTGGDVACLGCGDRYGLPAGATVLEDACESCGLPLMRVDRGATFEVCVDYACDPLDEAVRERFDRAWSCPDCGEDLRIIRARGRLLAGCDAYPDCETAFSLPSGVVAGECACGLPAFETAAGRRCLDGACQRFEG
ncbi:topoisomerase DNA-binding C4 zinc finger domain-containing protein [Halegenticoccus soli]|uniref:topoisomerase DNA-binding C4 zinc finger domain-containing protein n=1 Tax=Halegenticoccus soli TaxID=1985678 RepID=UPI000C6CC170|nr:topoisomerase DNA-binding C4 zinc finger domain-containing protein [Halegenticoccus soli]